MERTRTSLPAHYLDNDAAAPGNHDSDLYHVEPNTADGHVLAADHSELPRLRLLDFPAASILPGHSQRSSGCRPDRWRLGNSHLLEHRAASFPSRAGNDRPLCLCRGVDRFSQSADLPQRSQDVYAVESVSTISSRSMASNGDR